MRYLRQTKNEMACLSFLKKKGLERTMLKGETQRFTCPFSYSRFICLCLFNQTRKCSFFFHGCVIFYILTNYSTFQLFSLVSILKTHKSWELNWLKKYFAKKRERESVWSKDGCENVEKSFYGNKTATFYFTVRMNWKDSDKSNRNDVAAFWAHASFDVSSLIG